MEHGQQFLHGSWEQNALGAHPSPLQLSASQGTCTQYWLLLPDFKLFGLLLLECHRLYTANGMKLGQLGHRKERRKKRRKERGLQKLQGFSHILIMCSHAVSTFRVINPSLKVTLVTLTLSLKDLALIGCMALGKYFMTGRLFQSL